MGKPLPVGAEFPDLYPSSVELSLQGQVVGRAPWRLHLAGEEPCWHLKSVSRRPPSRWCRAGATKPRLSPKVLAAEAARAGAQGGEAVPTPKPWRPTALTRPRGLGQWAHPAHAPGRPGQPRATPPGAGTPPPPVASAAGRRSPGAPPSLPEKNSPRRQRATREKRTRGCALLMAGGGRRGSRGKPGCRSTRAPASREQAGSAVPASESDGASGGH